MFNVTRIACQWRACSDPWSSRTRMACVLSAHTQRRHRLERDHNCAALAASVATAAACKSEDDWLKSFGSNSAKFKNAPASAVGDAKIPESDRFLLAVNFPQALQRPPLYSAPPLPPPSTSLVLCAVAA